MKVLWRAIDVVGYVIIAIAGGVLWAASKVRASRQAYIIQRDFDGDKDAYDRDQWKNS